VGGRIPGLLFPIDTLLNGFLGKPRETRNNKKRSYMELMK
jgi:hypothetical protein